MQIQSDFNCHKSNLASYDINNSHITDIPIMRLNSQREFVC